MKALKLFFVLALVVLAINVSAQQKKYVMVIHGGAGTILKKNMTPEKEAIYIKVLTEALQVKTLM